jgi:hypothetical protein
MTPTETAMAKRQLTVRRRDLLHVFGGGATVALTGGSLAARAAADTEKSDNRRDEKCKARYRQTEHVKTF